MTTVGVIGGGQLGRMLALAGVPLGVRCVVVEPADDSPAAPVADVIQAPFDDPAALATLAARSDVVTVELEQVPVDALSRVAKDVPVRPSPTAVAIAQDRRAEKLAFAAAGIATAPWADHVVAFPAGTVVKRRTGGYDGRGQVLVAADAPVDGVLDGDCISEELVPFDRELSIVAARGLDGTVACYPVVENRHAEGILRTTLAPAPGLTPGLQAQAEAIARALLESLDYVGVLAVELFQVGAALLANEMAPRVHNSGHWTIEGSATSQFEQHLRAVCGWPLGSTDARPTAMVNIIGSLPEVPAVLAVPGAHLHLYGKAPRAARKLGHVTVPAERLPE
ncbi:MAG TPA: 5-(carboxyamino)imidazole ribonucleotide synthase, partial [Acidimicrobiales bacterium]|nr:5-(carboxyamino)imidazole ribonucleotide synthase [Acidimicrobiales bacterium]